MDSLNFRTPMANMNISQEELEVLLPAIDELEALSQDMFNELEPYDGMMNENETWQIRTGIIQDPSYDAFQDRFDGENLKSSAYTYMDDTSHDYPFNGLNSVDPIGMRVSVLWIDGFDGGEYRGQGSNLDGSVNSGRKLKSTVTSQVQRLVLTFPQAWADLDRSCGDFSLPVAGTVCRIGMARGNVGVYLGAMPLDKSKLPHLRLGDFLRRNFTQSCQYITDTGTQAAYATLDKNIYKEKELLLEARPDTEDYPKPHETDTEVLDALRKYHSHRQVFAEEGVSTTAKVCNNKHETRCAKRAIQDTTNQTIEDAVDKWVTILTEPNVITLNAVAADGILNVHRDSDGRHYVEMTTELGLGDAMSLVADKFNPKAGKIIADDGILNFNCVPVAGQLTLPTFDVNSCDLTLLQLAAILIANFNVTLARGCQIVCKDATVNWTNQMGQAYSCILTAAVLLVQVSSFMARPPKFFTISGYDSIISGDSGPPDCAPRPSVTIPTCDIPLLPA